MSLAAYMNNKPLSAKQRGILGGLYSKAYKRAVTHFATDDLDAEAWRHEQCRRMVGCTISEAMQKHWNLLRMYGEDLSGNSGAAFAIALQMPREMCAEMRRLVEAGMQRWGINWGYITAVVKGKFEGKPLDDLNPFEWEQLLYTVNNRGKAIKERKEGEFDGSKRNKKQREKKPEPSAPVIGASGHSIAEEWAAAQPYVPEPMAPLQIQSTPRAENEPVSYWEMIQGGRVAQ